MAYYSHYETTRLGFYSLSFLYCLGDSVSDGGELMGLEFMGKKQRKVWRSAWLCLFWAIWQDSNYRYFEDVEQKVQELKHSFICVFLLWPIRSLDVEHQLVGFLLIGACLFLLFLFAFWPFVYFLCAWVEPPFGYVLLNKFMCAYQKGLSKESTPTEKATVIYNNLSKILKEK